MWSAQFKINTINKLIIIPFCVVPLDETSNQIGSNTDDKRMEPASSQVACDGLDQARELFETATRLFSSSRTCR